MKPGLRMLGWVLAVVWATGMTVALARISGTLDAIAARPPAPAVVGPAAQTGPSEVAISLRAAPGSALAPPAGPAPPAGAPSKDERVVPEATPEQQAAHDQADAVLAQIVQKGRLDDDSTQAMRAALTAMRAQDRIQVLSAFAAAATRGEIDAAPEDYRRILP
jgi:hypothetical protein